MRNHKKLSYIIDIYLFISNLSDLKSVVQSPSKSNKAKLNGAQKWLDTNWPARAKAR